jgi:hypothetical protein
MEDQMEQIIKDIGLIIRCMELGFIFILMAIDMKVNLNMI